MRSLSVLAAALVAAPAAVAAAQTPQRYTVSGDNVAIYNLAGAVRVEGGTGADVVVEVSRGGDDAAKLQIETGAIGARQTLRVVYPDDDIVYSAMGFHSSTTLDVRDDGTFSGDRGAGRGHRVRISGGGSGLDAHADLRVLVPAGRRIAVYLAVGRMTAANVNGDVRLDVSSADVEASGMKGSLAVDAGSGDVRVTGATGNLDLDTGSGTIVASGVTGDVLSFDTGSGDVTLDRAEGRSLKIDTGSGDARATAVKADDLLVDTGSGDVTLELLAGGGSIDIDTGSGAVNLTLPSGYGADVVLDTGSGEIDLGGIAVTVRKVQEDHLEGRIGDGKGRLHVETGSGDVRLKKV